MLFYKLTHSLLLNYMQYLVYLLVLLLYVGSLIPICFIWQWGGWFSYVLHIASILLLTILFTVLLGIFVFLFHKDQVVHYVYNAFIVPYLALLAVVLDPRNWFLDEDAKIEMFESTKNQLLLK